MAYDVDLFVIGAGSGGVRAGRIAASHGARVMVAEEYRVGGTCVIRGCVPKKLLAYAADFGHAFEDAAGFGWRVKEAVFDWPTLIANKDREIARLEAAYAANLGKSGAEIIASRAVVEDAHTVRLMASGARIRAAHILVATGGAPDHGPDIPGIEHVISSNEAFHLERLPSRIVIQGGSYIAAEFACIFAGLGTQVTMVYRGEEILRGFDEDVRAHVAGEMRARGISIITNATVTAVQPDGGFYRASLSNGQAVACDKVMFAIGRRPNTQGLGLEQAGVALSARGAVKVDAASRSSVPSIFAVGDVTDRINLTPVAIREGHLLADMLFGGKSAVVDHTGVATAVFCDPEIGTVGLTETEARAAHAALDIYKANFRPMKHTLSGRATRMLMKIIVDGTNDKVLGCHIVGDDAAEMIQLVAIAIKMGATKAQFDATMALHPTAAEELVTMRSPTARWRRDAA
jgi:glutathione reductase (NADPH)